MKKAAIITIVDKDNYGNRLQNYAVQETLRKYKFDTTTINNTPILNSEDKYVLRKIKYLLLKLKSKKECKERKDNFERFDNNINIDKKMFNIKNKEKYSKYDYFFVGSDQVWNPYFGRLRDLDLLLPFEGKRKIAISASFGISKLPNEYESKVKKALKDFNGISVRENDGKKIVENITGRKDVEVLIDPTMMVSVEEWDKVAVKPKQLKKNKYILNYFLGKLSEKKQNEIERIAKENDCEIINILDKNSEFYKCGPSEFLYLEKNAFLICTDSFHSCVFSILYNVPFVVFNRDDSVVCMNSRINTLLKKFQLEERYVNEKIDNDLLMCDFKQSMKILEEERLKADSFLRKYIENGDS